MTSRRAIVAVVLAAVSCQSGPPIRPGPAVRTRFSPPAGLALVNHGVEVRIETIELPKTNLSVRRETKQTTLEEYAPQPDGTTLVTTTLLESVATKDGLVMPEPLNLTGIRMVSRIDASGRFVGLENVKEVLDQVRARIPPQARGFTAYNLTPEKFSGPAEQSWRRRFDNLCGHELVPGGVTYSLDEWPVDEIGPVHTVARERVLGMADVGMRNADEISLEFGGRDSSFAHAPGALDQLLMFPDGVNMLSVGVHGEGREFIDPATCQIFREEEKLTGSARLNPHARTSNIELPLKIDYEISRQILRMLPAEAVRVGIPTTLIQAEAAKG
jgi:hypothetical protein